MRKCYNILLSFVVIFCLVSSMQAMKKPFCGVDKKELRALILKSIPYSGSISKEETQDSLTYGTRLFYVHGYLSCTYHKHTKGHNSCTITELDTGKAVTIFGREAQSYLNELYAKRIQMAGLSDFNLKRQVKGFRRCKKLLDVISKIEHIATGESYGDDIIQIATPKNLICHKEKLKNGGSYISCAEIVKSKNDKLLLFDGDACWEVLESRLAELEKEKEELS